MYNVHDVTPEHLAKWRDGKAESHLNSPRCDGNGVPLTGVFEDNKVLIREMYIDGICYELASKMWVDSPGESKPAIAVAPWGSYPEIPPKPPKKK